MITQKKIISCALLLFSSVFYLPVAHAKGQYKRPTLTIVIVIDQFAYHYLNKLKPHLKNGIRMLMDKAISYENAHHPHGTPSTAPGHTGLSTGAYADIHGIIDNSWMDQTGKKVSSVEDSSSDAAVIAPTGFHAYGRSPKNMETDTFCTQFMLYSKPEEPHHAVSISLKDRAAICMGGELGKAFWFDCEHGIFTSSKAYFNTLPDWVSEFNKTHGLKDGQQCVWKMMYPVDSPAYRFDEATNYKYSGYNFSLIGKKITLDFKSDDPCEYIEKIPLGNQLVVDLAKQYIKREIKKTRPDRHMMWVSFSSLDKLGHFYGPYSREIIDMIYQLDRQVKDLIDYAHKAVGKGNVLFVLSADHGVMPIPELLNQQGVSKARRIIAGDICKKLNKAIEDNCSVKGLIDHYNAPAFNFNKKIWKRTTPEKKKAIIPLIKKTLLEDASFQQVWTFEELKHLATKTGTIDYHFKRQLFPNRSGEIICRLQPYHQITKYSTGTTHCTPYTCDTQVPLFIFQDGALMKKQITKKVISLQLVPTLADLLKVPKPSAAGEKSLPGITI